MQDANSLSSVTHNDPNLIFSYYSLFLSPENIALLQCQPNSNQGQNCYDVRVHHVSRLKL